MYVESSLPSDFDWATMQSRSRPDVRWFLDHTVVEREVAHLAQKIAHLQLLQMQIYPLTL
jgi:hypothetical protein